MALTQNKLEELVVHCEERSFHRLMTNGNRDLYKRLIVYAGNSEGLTEEELRLAVISGLREEVKDSLEYKEMYVYRILRKIVETEVDYGKLRADCSKKKRTLEPYTAYKFYEKFFRKKISEIDAKLLNLIDFRRLDY